MLAAAPASAVIVGVEDPAQFQDPASLWYGMNWDHVYSLYAGGNPNYLTGGSYVAIGYFRLLTARHFTTSAGDTLWVNGDEFEVVSTAAVAKPDGDTHTYWPALQVVTLKNNPAPACDVHTGEGCTGFCQPSRGRR